MSRWELRLLSWSAILRPVGSEFQRHGAIKLKERCPKNEVNQNRMQSHFQCGAASSTIFQISGFSCSTRPFQHGSSLERLQNPRQLTTSLVARDYFPQHQTPEAGWEVDQVVVRQLYIVSMVSGHACGDISVTLAVVACWIVQNADICVLRVRADGDIIYTNLPAVGMTTMAGVCAAVFVWAIVLDSLLGGRSDSCCRVQRIIARRCLIPGIRLGRRMGNGWPEVCLHVHRNFFLTSVTVC